MSSDANRKRAFQLHRVEGKSLAETARLLDTSAPSAGRWSKSFEAEHPEQARAMLRGEPPPASFMDLVRARVETRPGSAPPPAPAEDDEDGDDASADDGPIDAIAMHQQAIRDLKKAIDDARAIDNLDAVAHFNRTMQGMLASLRQLEKAKQQDEGVLHLSEEDLAQGRAQLEKLLEIVSAQPRMCAECGREMRMREATNKKRD